MAGNRQFTGMGTALVSPFLPNGAWDRESFRRLVDYQLREGADFLVVHGTTGESPCLSREERDQITEALVEQVQGRVPIVIGLGGNNTREIAQRVAQIGGQGIDGVLSVVPYYNKPTQEGIYQHFAHIAEHSPLPIILYNVPGRVGVNMMPETVARLAERYPNIVGLKEASGFVSQGEKVVELVAREDFIVLSGDDALSTGFIRNGAQGVISVVGNAYPKFFAHVIRMASQGLRAEAEALQDLLRDVNTQLFANGNPAGIKALLTHLELIDHNVLRLPLVPATEEVYHALTQAHERFIAEVEPELRPHLSR